MTLSTAAPDDADLHRRRTIGAGYLYTQAGLAALAALAALTVLAARFVPPALASAWEVVAARGHWPSHGTLLLLVALGGAALFGANYLATSWVVGPNGYQGPSWVWIVSTLLLLAGAGAACISGIVLVVAAFSAPPTGPAAFF